MEIVKESTKKRLIQVKSMLTEMETTFNAEDLDKFDISLNNFITNARTITFLLQNEFSKNERFLEWYELKRKEMKIKGFDKFVDMRNTIEKQGNMRNTNVFHVNVTEKNEPGACLLTAEIDTKGKKKNKIYGKFELKPFFGSLGSFDLTKLNEDAIKQSKDYLDYLSNLVGEAYKKFEGNSKKEASQQ